MKKMFKNLMLVAVAAMAFVGCNNDLISVDTLKKPTVITFNASMEDDTRTSMTDENSDGKYEVNWSAGDQVAFVVYGDNDSIIEIQTATVAEAGASAELTVEFTSELAIGQRIVAYCNYNCGYDGYWGTYYFYQPYLSYQNPKQNDVEKHYISAEYTYNGEAVAPLKFSHDYAYAKMVIERLEGIEAIDMTFNDTETISLNCYNVTNNIYMFTCPAMAVNKINVEVTTYDDNDQLVYYTFNKELAAGKLTFNKGRIAKFTIKDWKSILASPYVQATEITPNSITFSWEAVANAKDYTYTVNGTTETTEETSVVVNGLEPLTEYRITVVANPENSETHATSKEGYAYATTGADRSVLDKEFTEVVEFANMTKLENYTNTYLFTTDGGGTTITDKFMYLKFNNEIDFSNSGEYSIDDLYSGDSECCIWVGREVADCRGYTDHYKLGFIPYHFYPNYGDTYIIYVDVVDGKSTITVYANNASYWSALKFKGVYVEKEALATPVVTTTVERNTIKVTWEPIEGAANYTVTCGDESKTIEGTTATFEGLEYATEYTVSVVANPAEPTKYKASLAGEATATTVTLTTLATPSNLNYTIEGDIVTITWDAVENAANYYVYAWNQPYETTADTNSAQFTLAEYGYYHFYIIAKAKVDSLYKDSYEAYVGVSYEDPRPMLELSNVSATASGNTVTISWDTVEDAGSYTVTFNGIPQDTTNTEVEFFELEYNKEYYYNVVANPKNEETHRASYPYSGYVTTERDPNAGFDYDITFTSCTVGSGNMYTFTDGSYTLNLKLNSALEVGIFENTNDNYWVGDETTLDVPNVNYSSYIYNGKLEVSLDGDIYTIVLTSFDCWVNGIKSTIKLTYVGSIGGGSSSGPDTTGYTLLATGSHSWGGSTLIISDTYYELQARLYNGGAGSTVVVGDYTFGGTKSIEGTISGFNLVDGSKATIYDNGNGTYTVLLDLAYSVGTKKLYYTFSE